MAPRAPGALVAAPLREDPSRISFDEITEEQEDTVSSTIDNVTDPAGNAGDRIACGVVLKT
jgi:hypothetical protein